MISIGIRAIIAVAGLFGILISIRANKQSHAWKQCFEKGNEIPEFQSITLRKSRSFDNRIDVVNLSGRIIAVVQDNAIEIGWHKINKGFGYDMSIQETCEVNYVQSNFKQLWNTLEN